ncbi:MAG: hypothetical protein KBC96_12490 [Armatimonadetes bacterium]|nr:hypothetical protein [Armatimonadota bacterium]
MRTSARIMFLILMMGLLGSAHAARWRDEIAALTKEVHSIRLEQIAIVVADESANESGLLIRDGVGANPDLKYPWREEKWGDIPAIKVTQVYVPVNAQLEGIDPGRILGAVALLVEGSSAKDATKKVRPGVYMLYMLDRPSLTTTGETDLALISVAVGDKPDSGDEGKVSYSEALRIPAKVVKVSSQRLLEKTEEVTVTFPKSKDVTPEKPADRAAAVLRWGEQSLRFDLDLALKLLQRTDKS